MASFVAFRSAVVRLPGRQVRHLHSTPVSFSKYRLENKRIPYETLHLIDPETGQLREIVLKDYLDTIDTKKYKLELVSTSPKPVARLLERWKEHEKLKAAKTKRLESLRKAEHKEFQFTWNMAPSDLTHKFNSVRKELEKGGKADLVFVTKKGHRAPKDIPERLQAVVDELADVAKEYKGREIVGPMGAIFLRGTGEKPADQPSKEPPS
ncbi:uncharacterized protein BT62DRAFT_994418 [Guyanagaster necrorhizus]|uniref:Translation initiation factor IF-3 n=1 Tax=Guyanagaster necrorhizus TaxID=856835 RepID=A0A9P8ATN1_9AGAR|nr:uncharacterized protein BT62DRAFT_994418 [Guyanagaster necrorhizus MCA 3950]KAG7446062.1 hypothetical protein BT62DRAFT_994418 [Guyanagaster necrorhizus MCA 3950]